MNAHYVWAKHHAAQMSELRALTAIVDSALEAKPPAFRVAVQATLAKSRIRRELLETGWSLGIWDRVVAEQESFVDPTAAMFLEAAESITGA